MSNLPTRDEIKDTFELLDSWEDRYAYIIELGRALPQLAEEFRLEEYLVRGCQSLVWLITEFRKDDQTLHFRLDSDAHIVRGLITIVLANVQDRSPEAIRSTDLEGYFGELDLLSHLSPTRGNGLKAMVQRIQSVATEFSGGTE